MKVLAFDVWGEFGHFRKHYTTTSPLTYSIPPRTAISGMVGAILGFGKDEYLNNLSKTDSYISVQIINPIKKTRVSENLIDTKIAPMMSKIKTRTQIRFEMLKDARYRIYFSHDSNEIYDDLHDMLENHKSVYIPCLGLSELLAGFDFVGEFDIQKEHPDSEVYISTVIPESNLRRIDFVNDNSNEMEYFSESMPLEMLPSREVKEYDKILYERNGKRVSAIVNECWKLENGERIVFL